MSADVEALRVEAEKQQKRYDLGSKAWSALHHWSLVASAVASAIAALLLEMESLTLPAKTDVAAALAALATLLTTLAVSGGFDRKWKTNRRSRGKIENVLIDLTNSNADEEKIRDTLKQIKSEHDEGIVGA